MIGWMDDWMDDWMIGWMIGWMDYWMDGLLDGFPHGLTGLRIRRRACTHARSGRVVVLVVVVEKE